MREINFYRTTANTCPVEEFLDSLTGKQAQKVAWVLRLIEDFDRIPAQYLKKLVNTEDIWEVRVQFGNNIFRLLGFFEGDNLLILTSGFTKKTQKTPPSEIALATTRKEDYLARKRTNERRKKIH